MSSAPAPGCRAEPKRGRSTAGPGYLWVTLPGDLVRQVAWRVLADGDLLDYVRFRAVCSGWRSGAASPRGRGVTDPRFHPRRWMMLPEGHCLHPGHPDLGGYARFLNLDSGALVRSRIPLLEDHCAIDSVDGLLLLLGDQYQRGTVRLLHPFTGDIAELPPLATLLPLLVDTSLFCRPVLYRIKCLASGVCASASFKDGVITVMLALGEVHLVAFATSLDQQWKLSSWDYPIAAPPLAFQGKLYMLGTTVGCGDNVHQFLQIDPPVQQAEAGSGAILQPPQLIATIPVSKFRDPEYLEQRNTVEMESTRFVCMVKIRSGFKMRRKETKSCWCGAASGRSSPAVGPPPLRGCRVGPGPHARDSTAEDLLPLHPGCPLHGTIASYLLTNIRNPFPDATGLLYDSIVLSYYSLHFE